jgi:hypothetical protein
MLGIAKFSGWILVMALLVAGCARTPDTAGGTSVGTTPVSVYLMKEKPANPQGVAQARAESQNDAEVTVEGRIGGSAKPFVDGIAAFTIVDSSLQWCAEDEGCPTPWDYCCSDKTGKMALVKVVGADGEPVATDARELLGVKELSPVVVRGKAQRDEQGNLSVLAVKVYVGND